MAEVNYRLNDPRRRRSQLEMDGSAMKLYGCIAMLFYTISFSVIRNGMIRVDSFGPGELAAAMEADPGLLMLSMWGTVFQFIGSLAVPVFAFLLVEGFLHTSNFKKYLLTMLAFAIISEPAYDLARSGMLWDLSGQNVMFTYALCLVMLYGLRLFQGREGLHYRFGQLMIVAAAVLWSLFFQCAFGLGTVLLAAVYYLWRDKKKLRVLLGCAVSALYVTAPLSGYAIWCYNGRRGKTAEKFKYVFYVLYPAHLLVLGLVARALTA